MTKGEQIVRICDSISVDMVFEFAGLPRLIENNKPIFVLLFPRYSTVIKLRVIDLKLQIMGFDFQI